MLKKTMLILLAMAVLTAGCSTMRMKYEGTAKMENGKTVKVNVEKSYPVGGGYKEWCYITAIGLGGFCWFYMVLPTVPQKKMVYEDIRSIVQSKYGTDKFELNTEYNDLVSWEQKETELSFQE